MKHKVINGNSGNSSCRDGKNIGSSNIGGIGSDNGSGCAAATAAGSNSSKNSDKGSGGAPIAAISSIK